MYNKGRPVPAQKLSSDVSSKERLSLKQERFLELNTAPWKNNKLLDTAKGNPLLESSPLKEERWRALRAQRDIVGIDARKLSGFFLPVIIAKAKFLGKNSMLLVKQSFEPSPLYNVLGKMGFVHYTEQISKHEFCAYFIRTKEV
jgi:hypothetical protein